MPPSEEHRPDLPSRGMSPDPYLRAFLRQAVAVIAAERGFNDASGAKLHQLAKQLGLSEQAFQDALEKLKQPSSSLGLNRYERQFVEFLGNELRKLKGDVLTIKYEQRVIDLAENKYQIDPVRAQQLLQKTAQQQQVGMISHADAHHYAKHLIAEAAGNNLSIAAQDRERLYRACKNLGLEQWEVDRALQKLLAQNRWQRQKSRVAILMGSLAVVAGVAAMVAIAIYWEPLTGIGIQSKNENNPSTPTAPSIPVGLEWWNSDVETSAKELAQQDSTRPLLQRLIAPTAEDRPELYGEFASIVCESRTTFPALNSFLAHSFWNEPDTTSAMAIVQHLLSRLSVDDQKVVTARKIREADRANLALAAIIDATPSSLASTDKRQDELHRKLNEVFLARIPTGSSHEFFQQTKPLLSTMFWTYALKSCEVRPDRVAAILPELENDAHSEHDLAINELRTKTLLTILSERAFHWEILRLSIKRSIEKSDQAKLVAWIHLQSETRDRGLAEFLLSHLAKQLELDPDNLDRDAQMAALKELRLEFEIPGFRKIAAAEVALQQKLETTAKAYRFPFGFQPNDVQALSSTNLTDQIKTVARLNNLILAWLQSTQQTVINFDRFETLANQYVLDPRQRPTRPDSPNPNQATASERRALQAALKKIFDSEPSLVAARLTALRKLRDLAERVDHLPHQDARQLAQYILTEKDVRETLMVEGMLPRLAHWTELKLALADQIASTKREIDFVQEVVTRLEVSNRTDASTGNWKLDIQRSLLEQVMLDLEESDLAPNTSEPWNQLRNELQEIYSDRLRCVGTAPESVASQSLVDQNRRIYDRLSSLAPAARPDFKPLIETTGQSSDAEMAQLALIHQVHAEFWLAQLSNGDTDARSPELSRAEKIFVDYQTLVATGELNQGQWLLCSELLLNQVLHQYQKHIRKRLQHD